MVKKLTPQWMETSSPDSAAANIANVVESDLAIEDQLNDEVRDMLEQYSEYMRKEGVSYQDMFRKIKNTLISAAQSDSRGRARLGRRHEALAR